MTQPDAEWNFPELRDRQDLDHLFNLAYEELRRLASAVRQDDPVATATPTTLVHEAWLKLANSPGISVTSFLHFKRIAARAMRQLLVEAARRRKADKRGGSHAVFVTLTFAETLPVSLSCEDEIVALDNALIELARLSPRQALMVETRFFGGLEVPETAELLGVSEATVHRDWKAARAWLKRELRQVRRVQLDEPDGQ